jgi:hypothetical protein
MGSSFWCIMLTKKVPIASDKVVMHIPTKPYMSHTCPCHLARDVHPCADVQY